jgi:hypothetical protein
LKLFIHLQLALDLRKLRKIPNIISVMIKERDLRDVYDAYSVANKWISSK